MTVTDGGPTDGDRAAGEAPASDVLRRRTRDCHDAVEGCVRVSERLCEADRYAELLAYFARTLRPVEAWLAAHAVAVAVDGATPMGGVAMLEADLRAVGRGDLLSRDAASETSFDPGGQSAADVFGVLYVVEGSALGGQMIARSAGDALGVTAARGASFFARGGQDGMAGWRAFKADLNDRVRERHDVDRCVASARATFTHFIRMAETLP